MQRRGGLVVGLLLALALGTAAAAPLADAGPRATRPLDGRVVLGTGRGYVLHVPARAGAAAGRPALLVLHGLTSNPRDVAVTTGFDRLADRDGVLVAYPEGFRNSFNAGLCCGAAAELAVDDLGYLTDVVADLRRRGAGRVAVVGFSNGGMMAYRFACERPDLVDSVGVYAGTLEIPVCRGRIRALHLHGAEDVTVPFAGAAYSGLLHAFLRDVRTIPGAAPGSDIRILLLPHQAHRWTVRGDVLDASAAFWSFAGLGAAPGMGSATPG